MANGSATPIRLAGQTSVERSSSTGERATPPSRLSGWRPFSNDEASWRTPERRQHGLTIILPGIEGASWFNRSIARGLLDADHESAIVIEDWTTGYWPLFPYHLMAIERNRGQAQRIAETILEYQASHPDRPVCLIGHSGGGAMAVLVLESLPPGAAVSRTILLGAALSPQYDLRTALRRCNEGLWNVHSPGDIVYLAAGTLTLGTIDRVHTVSAGCLGFDIPQGLEESDRRLYEHRLHQVPYELRMAQSWNLGGHFGFVNRTFVADWIAPLVGKVKKTADRIQDQ
jgi:pimeloyl-ACP methyl ester carboxylesterase